MNFTREPIIETVITPREGCKLVVRNSKGNGQEDYFVDAIEVVSFGHSFFFRSQERPKSFLVPVSDYEILELKETRMVLKNVPSERAIKIGGGRDSAPPRQQQPREEAPPPSEPDALESRPAPTQEPRPQGRRDNNRRRRGRRGRDRHDQPPEARPNESYSTPPRDSHSEKESDSPSEEHLPESQAERPVDAPADKGPSFISKLFPPPPTLIRETLSRYKPAEEAPSEESSYDLPPEISSEDDNEE